MKTFETDSAAETGGLARELGEKAVPGMVIGLTGDLGCGKTVFAKGFAKGLGIDEHVNSPTYTLMQQYGDGRLPFYHFDVYRIGDISEMDETGFEDCVYGDGVTLVEWAELIRDIMPEDTVWISIKKEPDKGYDYRKIEIADEHSGD